MRIKFIYGMSGCAKTTTAMKSIKNMPLSQWICIAFTHSAVNNLKDIFMKLTDNKINIPQNNFMTIHKFLQIPVNGNGDYSIIKRKQLKYLANLIIVDEFSLIPLDIIEYLFELSISANVDMVFVGDFIQLMPISLTREPISLNLLSSDFSNINMTFNEAIRIADHLSNSVYTSKYFESAQKMILLHNYRNGSKVNQVLNDALDYKFNKAMGAADDNIISLFEIPKYVNDGYIILSSMYCLLEQAYMYVNPVINENEHNKLKNTKIGKVKIDVGDKLVLLENLDSEFVNGDEVIVKSLLDENDIEIIKNENLNENKELIQDKYNLDKTLINENEIIKSNNNLHKISTNEDKLKFKYENEILKSECKSRIINCNKILPYNFITCHKAQGRTIPKVLLILDDLFEITMLYTAITRARDDIKFIKFKHLPSKTDISSFKIMRDVIYKLPNENIKLKPKKMKKKMKMKNILNIDYENVCMNDENLNVIQSANSIKINSNSSTKINSNSINLNSNSSKIVQTTNSINLNQTTKINSNSSIQSTNLNPNSSIQSINSNIIQSINYSNVQF